MSVVLKIENLWKEYRLGVLGHGMLFRDLQSWWARLRGKEDPNSVIGRSGHGHESSDRIWALRDVSLEVTEGQVLGIIGRNGAGKSTLLKILSRVTAPTKGRVKIKGRIASLLEVGTGFHGELTGRENVFLNGTILGMTVNEIKKRFDEIVDFSGVEKFIDTPVKRYSSGMYVRLAFAVAAHLECEILVVDEVLAVGDVNFRQKCLGKMQKMTTSGRTILFVSHDMSSIRSLCNRVVWVHDGRLIREGSGDEVTAAYETEARPTIGGSLGRFRREPKPAKAFYFDWVELQDVNGAPSTAYQFGDVMDIVMALHGDAPQDSFTIEWLLRNEKGARISFGAANPVCTLYLNRGDNFVRCRLGPLPLTSGQYTLSFSVRVWGLERWDDWRDAASFAIVRCDPFGTGHDVPGGANGDFMIPQVWEVLGGHSKCGSRLAQATLPSSAGFG